MNFTLSDLKEGMSVKLRSGAFRVVFCGCLRGKSAAFQIKNLNDDLTHKYSNSADVVAVWPVPKGSISINEMLNPEGEPLWVRKDPIQLSDDERVILSNVDQKYVWIARDRDSKVFAYVNKPSKNEYGRWESLSYILLPFDKLFNFVKWKDDEPVNFRELMKK